jgi:gamma-glutamylcyclotransferase (GGCT)/AIG2-like uncharacterized protein YtfP
MKTIAVYGSLKRGKYNHDFYLKDAKKLGEIDVIGTMYLVSSYPALVDDGENEYVAEVYEVDDETFESLDRMESGAGYVQKIVEGAVVWYAGDALRVRCENNYKIISSY